MKYLPSDYMPEPTSMGGGYSFQVCGSTYASQADLINHGRDEHPGQAVTWGDPSGSSPEAKRAEEKTA